MPEWKRNIFVNAIRARTVREKRSAENIIVEYTKLTEDEKQEVLEYLVEGGIS